jgi:hypothetical protein
MERDSAGDATQASAAQLQELEARLGEVPAPSDHGGQATPDLPISLNGETAPEKAVEVSEGMELPEEGDPEEGSRVQEPTVLPAAGPSPADEAHVGSREFVFAAAPSLPAKKMDSTGAVAQPTPVPSGEATLPSSNGVAYATAGAELPAAEPDGVARSFIVAPDTSAGTVLTPLDSPTVGRRFRLFRRR